MSPRPPRQGSAPAASFRRGVSVTGLGLLVAQGGQLLLLLPISRVFDPGHLGTFGGMAAVVLVAAACATGRYEMAVPLSRSPRERSALVALCLFLAVVLGAIVAATTTWWAPTELAAWPLAPATVLLWISLVATDDALRVALQREGRFGVSAGALVLRSAGGLSTALALGWWLGPSADRLVLGAVFGAAAGAVLQAAALLHIGGLRLVGVRELCLVARRHRSSPIFLLPGHIAVAVANQGPIYALGVIAGPASAGALVMAQRLLFQPLQFITGALQQAFFPEAARRYRASGECWSLYRRALLLLGACAIPVAMLATPLGPLLVELILGPRWREAAIFVQILAVAAAVRLLDAPLSSIRLVAGRYRFDLGWKIALMVAVVVGTTSGAMIGGGVGAVAGIAVAMVVMYSGSLTLAVRLARGVKGVGEARSGAAP